MKQGGTRQIILDPYSCARSKQDQFFIDSGGCKVSVSLFELLSKAHTCINAALKNHYPPGNHLASHF